MSHSNEYTSYIRSSEWHSRAKSCRNLTNDRCILFPWLKAHHTHHLHYQNMKNEMIIRDIVPLSRTAHSLVHIPILWNLSPRKPSPLRKPISNLLRVLFILQLPIHIIYRFLIPYDSTKVRKRRKK